MANLLTQILGNKNFNPLDAYAKGKLIQGQKIANDQARANTIRGYEKDELERNNLAKQDFFMNIMAAWSFAGDEQASKQMIQKALETAPADAPVLIQGAKQLLGLTGARYVQQLRKAIDFGGKQGYLPMRKSLSDQDLAEFNAITARTTAEKKKTPEMMQQEIDLRSQELDFEKQQFDYEMKYGKIPSGYQIKEGGGVEPIPGTKEDVARKEKQKRIYRTARETINRSEIINSAVDSAISKIGPLTAGFGSKALSNIRSTQARDVAELLGTIKANLGFDRLSEMRQNSPTGGALGQVSEMELAQLERSLTSLDQGQSVDQLLKNLQIVKKHYNRVIDLARKDYGLDGGKTDEGALPDGVTEEDIQFTMKKHNLSREEVLKRIGG